jgi:hypothetical protein
MSVNICTAYFSQIKYFYNNDIPISVMNFDPRWYHNGMMTQEEQFIDSRGIYNGLRCDPLIPSEDWLYTCMSPKWCKETPQTCQFCKLYYNQLSALNFNELMFRFSNLAENMKQLLMLQRHPRICLMFSESQYRPCGQKYIIEKWFHENGKEILNYKN